MKYLFSHSMKTTLQSGYIFISQEYIFLSLNII